MMMAMCLGTSLAGGISRVELEKDFIDRVF
jgi:hypothetical protein